MLSTLCRTANRSVFKRGTFVRKKNVVWAVWGLFHWPSQSPDLTPLDYFFEVLRRVGCMNIRGGSHRANPLSDLTTEVRAARVDQTDTCGCRYGPSVTWAIVALTASRRQLSSPPQLKVSTEQRRNARSGGNGRSLRKLAEQRHRATRLPLTKIRDPSLGIEPAPARLNEVTMEQRRNVRVGEMEVPREIRRPTTISIPGKVVPGVFAHWSRAGKYRWSVGFLGYLPFIRPCILALLRSNLAAVSSVIKNPLLRATQVFELSPSWTGDPDEVHFEPPILKVPNLDPRSATIVDKSAPDEYSRLGAGQVQNVCRSSARRGRNETARSTSCCFLDKGGLTTRVIACAHDRANEPWDVLLQLPLRPRQGWFLDASLPRSGPPSVFRPLSALGVSSKWPTAPWDEFGRRDGGRRAT
ncbi:hypothetical protein PR048_004775 [Dryococelus australis]|uniref:Uncharacterized protein n=1 Tax=Dryococelus australis TaxID=614101 RepID=A0ABQ9I7F6_9NEOP|nr:hypothetical protein PR048_004775 [Dryococelus australis]